MRFLALLAVPALLALGAESKEEKCPISGKPAKSDISLNVNGKLVHFCCKECPAAYKKQIGLTSDKCEKCPISGKPTNAETAVIEKSAKVVAFCCNECPKKFAAEHKLEVKDAGAKDQKCPISGKAAKDETGTSLVVNGKKIYFCCDKCPKAYLKKEFGITEVKAGTCPVSGKPAKEETAQILVESKTVAFCCEKCQGKYTEAHFKDGVAVSPAK